MYKHHCANLKILEDSIKLIQIDLRRYISRQDNNNVYIYTKILSYLVTCWAEVRILKLAYEPNAFEDHEKKDIIGGSTLENKWISALNISVCKAYNIKYTEDSSIIAGKLKFTPKIRYNELLSLIKVDLAVSIEERNRIAHGQWLIAFTNDLTKISSDITGRLRNENIVKLQLKIKLFKSLAQIINDLAVSPTTFERDFDMNYAKIEQQKNNLHNRSYDDYKNKMVQKYQRGIESRREVM